jgi:hypothetical protein
VRAGHLCATTMAGVVRGVDILLEFLHGELEIFEIWRKAVLPKVKNSREFIYVEIFSSPYKQDFLGGDKSKIVILNLDSIFLEEKQ